LIGFALALSSLPAFAQFRVPKLATSVDTSTTVWQALEFWQQELARISRDQFFVRVYPSRQLGTEQDMLQGVRFGHIEMTLLPVDSLSLLSPSLIAVSTPVSFRDREHRARILNGPVGKSLLATLLQHRMIGLGFFEAEPQGMFSVQPLVFTPDTFKDIRLGYEIASCDIDAEGGQHENRPNNILDPLSLLGIQAVPLCAEQADTALASGEIAAWKAPLFDWKHVPFAFSVVARIQSLESPYVLVANKTWFEGLAPEEQELLAESSRIAGLYQQRLLEAGLDTQSLQLQEAGVEVGQIEWEALYEAARPFYVQQMEGLSVEVQKTLQAIGRVK
jgi:TRAP-type C4-dicarboxylate transport system substrate-binding protein